MSAEKNQTGKDKSRLRRLLATTAIVGAGATGAGILKHLVKQYEKDITSDPEGTPDLTIRVFNASNNYGQGMPYEDGSPVFRLNQPATKMSLDQDSPDDFAAWISAKLAQTAPETLASARALFNSKIAEGMTEPQIAFQYPEEYLLGRDWKNTDFMPRNAYGYFLRDDFQATLDKAAEINARAGRTALSIDNFAAPITGLSPTEDGAIALDLKPFDLSAAALSVAADATVLATGHRKNTFLAEYQDNPDYLDAPMSMRAFKEKIGMDAGEGEDRPVVIIGTGNSMMDALAGLDAVGYKGKILALSPSAMEPWPYDPAKETQPRSDYPLQFVTPERMKGIAEAYADNMDAAAAEFRFCLVQEMHSSEAREGGSSQVLATLSARKNEMKDACHGCSGLFQKALELIQECMINHTIPERFDLFKKYKDEGRLEIRSGRVTQASALEGGGFEVTVFTPATRTEETVAAAKIVNAASMQVAPYTIDAATGTAHAANELVEDALQKGLVTPDTATRMLKPAEGFADGTLELAGPARGGTWGIPYTKDSFSTVAQRAYQHAMARAKEGKAVAPSDSAAFSWRL